ncbi:DUF1934 domain-containing protein [Niallia nealsonii]|uniref:DUF1934 domain-containing protein n=1 Tax=Niallia nealsonii TaxID=115979 RepID=A0A2N0YZA8_9BACI|nr:DUF1934 domain-containing protein [Niallia nealsonii]PKG22585.1 DUF1934 domain-containing protein [Niallia nealsonii]
MSSRSAEQVPVKIRVSTHIYNGKTKDSIEWNGFGQYLEKDNGKYIKYEETAEEGTIKTIIKITENEGLILRSGAVKMRLSFIVNKKRNGSYESPYGTFLVETDTKRMSLELSRESLSAGNFDLLYDLKMQGKSNGTYHMTIDFKEETEQK